MKLLEGFELTVTWSGGCLRKITLSVMPRNWKEGGWRQRRQAYCWIDFQAKVRRTA